MDLWTISGNWETGKLGNGETGKRFTISMRTMHCAPSLLSVKRKREACAANGYYRDLKTPLTGIIALSADLSKPLPL